MTPAPSFTTADAFLRALAGEEPVTFQMFDAREGKKRRELAHVVHGTLLDSWAELRTWYEKGSDVYVTVNRTDLAGRSAENVTALRALFIDYDTPDVPIRPWGLEPNLTVESSPGKVHAYWLLEDGEALSTFRGAQRALVGYYKSDPNIIDLPRVLRLPGFAHRKGEPHAVIFTNHHETRHTIAEVLEAHGIAAAAEPLSLSAARAPRRSSKNVPVGERNNHLMSLAGSMRRRGCDPDTILAALRGAASEFRDPPCTAPDSELEGIARSVERYEPDPVAVVVGDVPWTDSGNAERLVARHGEALRYVTTWKKWLTWDGSRWQATEAAVYQKALDTVRALEADLAGVITTGEDEKGEALRRWARKSESRSGLEAMVSVARHHPDIGVRHDALDADPWLLGTADGALDLRMGQLRPPSPGDLLTKTSGARGDITARSWASAAPTWARFLRDVTCGDTEMESYLQRAVGYTLTGSTREQCLFFLHGVGNEGNGSNGKSTFIETVMAAMGEYAIVGAQSLLLTKRNETHPTELAAVHGARLVAVQEMQANRTWDEVTIKTLTGDRVITARRMYEDFWNFTPTHKFWISGNGKPTVRGTDDGIWRRFRMIPFEAVFRDGARDVMLPEKLLGELPGVLAWAVAGCTAWQKRGLDEPAKIKAATAAYRKEQDTIGQFLEDVCLLEAGGRVKRSDMRRAYEWWCEQEGFHLIGARALTEQLRSRGLEEIATVREQAPSWLFAGSGRLQSKYNEPGWSGVSIRIAAEVGVPAPLRPN